MHCLSEGGEAMITKKYRKLHKGFTSVGAWSQKIVEVSSRTGYQWANSTTNDSCYSPSVYYVRSILNTFAFNLHRSPMMQVFSILLMRKQSLREAS